MLARRITARIGKILGSDRPATDVVLMLPISAVI
jgi:hypothetical protein